MFTAQGELALEKYLSSCRITEVRQMWRI